MKKGFKPEIGKWHGFQKGVVSHKLTENEKKNLSKRMIENNPMKNPIIIERMRLSKIGKPAIHSTGEKNWQWKGGITPLRMTIWKSENNKKWRSYILSRDKYICQHCFKKGGKLEVHHIKEFAKIIQEYKIKTLQDAINCIELWDTNNGLTLCIECHNKTKKWHKKLKD